MLHHVKVGTSNRSLFSYGLQTNSAFLVLKTLKKSLSLNSCFQCSILQHISLVQE